jgi:PAS domain S-box-containing protein
MASATSGVRHRIQVVEDEWIVASDLRNSLSGMGYEVTSVNDTGEEAVTRAGTDRPDIVLMDIMLRGAMDGIDAADIIRQRLFIPVVFLTALTDEGVLERAKRACPFGYLVKPFEDHELMSTIETALTRHSLEVRVMESERRFRSLVENAADAFYVCDSKGRVVDLNSAASGALGYSREELLEMTVPDFHAELDAEVITALFNEAKAASGPLTLSGRHIRKNGTSFPTEVRITCFVSEGRELLLALARDTSEHERLVDELKEALSKVNMFKSIIPICVLARSPAKPEDIDSGIRMHHDAIKNKGVCPMCLESFRTDIYRTDRTGYDTL